MSIFLLSIFLVILTGCAGIEGKNVMPSVPDKPASTSLVEFICELGHHHIALPGYEWKGHEHEKYIETLQN